MGFAARIAHLARANRLLAQVARRLIALLAQQLLAAFVVLAVELHAALAALATTLVIMERLCAWAAMSMPRMGNTSKRIVPAVTIKPDVII